MTVGTGKSTVGPRELARIATDRRVLAALEALATDRKSFRAAKSSPSTFLRKAGVTVPRGATVTLEGNPVGGDLPIRPYPVKELCIEVCVTLGRGVRICIRFCEGGPK